MKDRFGKAIKAGSLVTHWSNNLIGYPAAVVEVFTNIEGEEVAVLEKGGVVHFSEELVALPHANCAFDGRAQQIRELVRGVDCQGRELPDMGREWGRVLWQAEKVNNDQNN